MTEAVDPRGVEREEVKSAEQVKSAESASAATDLMTPRLRLSLPEPSDALDTAKAMTPAIHRWMVSWPCPMSREQAEARIAACRKRIAEGSAIDFVLRDRDSGEFVGWTSMWRTDEPDTWRIGLWIAEGQQDRGLGTEAASAVIDWVAAVHRPAAIDAMVSPANERSLAMVSR